MQPFLVGCVQHVSNECFDTLDVWIEHESSNVGVHVLHPVSRSFLKLPLEQATEPTVSPKRICRNCKLNKIGGFFVLFQKILTRRDEHLPETCAVLFPSTTSSGAGTTDDDLLHCMETTLRDYKSKRFEIFAKGKMRKVRFLEVFFIEEIELTLFVCLAWQVHCWMETAVVCRLSSW